MAPSAFGLDLPYGGVNIFMYFSHRSRILSMPLWSRSLSVETTEWTSEESDEKPGFNFSPCEDFASTNFDPCGCWIGRARNDLRLLMRFLSSQVGGLDIRDIARGLGTSPPVFEDISASFEVHRADVR